MAQDPESWMWEQALSMLSRAERLQREFFKLGRPHPQGPVWRPPADIFETDRELWIMVALPGVDPGQAQVVIEGRVLTVAAERPVPPQSRGALVHRLEIPYGRLERRIELPPGSFRLGERELAHGCLVLRLEKL